MARKIIDVQPIITARFVGGSPVTGENAAFAQVEDTIAALRPDFECEVCYEKDARCEHCTAIWTEGRADYNGGCCGLDEAGNPERLAELRKLAEDVEGADFYSVDEDGKRSRMPIDWAPTLAGSVVRWLDAGRQPGFIDQLIPAIKRVRSDDWCTVWEDPGPSGASLARLPDQVTPDHRPNELADELLSLIDDMGLLPARAA